MPPGPFSPLFIGAQVSTPDRPSGLETLSAFSPLFIGAQVSTKKDGKPITLSTNVFQSPLHRGTGFNLSLRASHRPPCCWLSVPSSSGHRFQPMFQHINGRRVGLSVPSSSGHRFQRSDQSTIPQPCRLSVPSSSGHRFQRQQRHRHCHAGKQLSVPSSSGHRFQQWPLLPVIEFCSTFSPLFIGAQVSTLWYELEAALPN